ncbi:MAG: Tfx family DNA-binding protein [Thermoprotei archaeon]|nr:MAG: Tfx family DNA-binding protein [Thermoprotei archaeon]RLF16486.1 MAG: Tfx family DNA-binding protein [Thermoprotei archaeon]
MPKRYGFLTELQLKVLTLKLKNGLTQEEIAKLLNTTRENIAIIERRAKRNVQLAMETVMYYNRLRAIAEVEVKPGTHLVEIPKLIIDAGDKLNVKLKVNFTKVYDEIKFRARGCVEGVRVVKPFVIAIYRDGEIEIMPKK